MALESRLIALNCLIAEQSAMDGTLASGRTPDTPDAAILVYPRDDMPGLFEIGDGHHRVAAAMRRGDTHITAQVETYADDEPYKPPFYVFPSA